MRLEAISAFMGSSTYACVYSVGDNYYKYQ